MRDIIWTIVVIWFVYKLVDVFKSFTSKRSVPSGRARDPENPTPSPPPPFQQKKDIKGAIQKHLNNDGEYVDFEEVK